MKMSARPPAPPTQPDREWFRSLFHENYRPLQAYARRRVDSVTADDVVAETLLVAWRRRDAAPAGHERPWLYGIARNVVRNSARSARRQQAFHETLRGLARQKAYDSEAVDEQAEVVRSALYGLSEDDREILMLVTWEGLPYADIGRVLDISANAVGIRVHRARKRLADQVAEFLGKGLHEGGNTG